MFRRFANFISSLGKPSRPERSLQKTLSADFEESVQVRVLKQGSAMRVIFFYPGEEGTYVDNAQVKLFENGIVHILSQQEETTTHLQNCEILWRIENEVEERANKVRLIRPKSPEGKSDTRVNLNSTSSEAESEKLVNQDSSSSSQKESPNSPSEL